jgi:hypothetical protein
MTRCLNLVSLLFVMSILAVSCDKGSASKSFYTFYNLTVNGSKKSVDACGTSDYVAEYLKDSAVFVAFGCEGEGTGFFLNGHTTDGTYHLDHINQAWYVEGTMKYTTDSLRQGTLTIRTGYYQGIGGTIPYIEGEISFDAIDNNTRITIRINFPSGESDGNNHLSISR